MKAALTNSLLSLQEAAWEFNVTTKWIWLKIQMERIRPIRRRDNGRHGRLFVKREELEALINQKDESHE